MKAVIIGLLGNSASVAFGAVGTPIRAGFAGLSSHLLSVPFLSAAINCLGFIVPIFMLWTMVSDQGNAKEKFLDALPFAIFSGLAFVLPSLATVFLGQEFPSILGSVIGVFLVFLALKQGLFLPKKIISLRTIDKPIKILSWTEDLIPYAILIGFLILSKFSPVAINPGLVFVVTGLVVTFVWGRKQKDLFKDSLLPVFTKVIEPFLVIFCMAAMTQLMLNNGQITLMTKNFQTQLLPFMTPFIGAFGAFITGSATISNLMFGQILALAAGSLSLNVPLILSLQLVGAAAGNMVALADILAAETIVGLTHKEREVLKGVIIPCLTYLFLVGLVGFSYETFIR